MKVNELITLNKAIRTNCEYTDKNLLYGIQDNNKIFFNTTGCKFSQLGLCIMCDYGKCKTPINLERLEKALTEIFSKFKKDETINYILFGANGSIFDKDEFPEECFNFLLSFLQQYRIRHICFESYYTTINASVLRTIKQQLPNSSIEIELGFESSNKEVRQNCFLKFIDNDLFKDKIKLIKSFGYECSVNILLGAPFLTLDEQIADVINSIIWAIDNGADNAIVFPLIIKKNTLLYNLYQNNLITQSYLYSLLEILKRLPDKYVNHVIFSWFNQTTKTDSTNNDMILPLTCKDCEKALTNWLNEFNKSKQNKLKFIKQGFPIQSCSCGEEFLESLNIKDNRPIKTRIEDISIEKLKI